MHGSHKTILALGTTAPRKLFGVAARAAFFILYAPKCGSLEARVFGRMTLSQQDLLCLVCARFGNKDKGPRKRRHALERSAGVDEISSYGVGPCCLCQKHLTLSYSKLFKKKIKMCAALHCEDASFWNIFAFPNSQQTQTKKTKTPQFL